MAAACHSHTTHSLLSWVELDQPWMETLVLPTVLPTVGAYWLTNPLKSAKTISYCGLDWEWELHPRPRPRKWGVHMRSAPFSGTARSQSLSWWLGRTPLWDGLVRVSWAISEVHQISPSMAAMAPMAGSMALVMVRLPHGLEPCYAHMPICLWRSITKGPGTTIFLALDITMDKTIP